MTRNQSAILAFAVGGRYTPGNGFTIAAAHTDSPCLRLKPISTLTKSGYLSVGVETYGGGLWYSWLDRDLSIAGKVIVESPSPAADGTADAAGGFVSRLVRIRRPILRIPSLAIHLNRDVNAEGLKLNAENHLPPVLCTAVKARLNGGGDDRSSSSSSSAEASPAGTGGALTRHHAPLVQALAAELSTPPESIKDFDLCLYDTQPSVLGGLYNEFVYSGRLDNLMMTFTCFTGLIESLSSLTDDPNVRMVASFDHEEVGSNSTHGASSTFLEDAMRRLCPSSSEFAVAARKSVLVSADMAHAVHPNYSGLHEENHRSAMHGGVVIKEHANQRYATTNETAFLFRTMAGEAGVPVQNFVVRQDMGCGSTIGPIVATRLGLRTVDVGLPQLSMHSVREMCGADDVGHAITFFRHFFKRFPSLDARVSEA